MDRITRSRAGGVLGGWLAAGVMSACGGIAVIDFDGATGQGGGQGAAQSSSPAATSTTSVGGGQIGCEGWNDSSCGASAHCQPDGDRCDGPGKCVAIPQSCPEDCQGVCACDGKTYCNACEASAHGVAVVPGLVCDGPPAESYHAWYWPGGMDHLLVGKKDMTEGSCIWAHLNYPANPGSFEIVAPKDWSVVSVNISNHADDCDDLSKQPTGKLADTTNATGTIKWVVPTGKSLPCELSIDMKAGFLNLPAGLKNAHELKANPITINQGCF